MDSQESDLDELHLLQPPVVPSMPEDSSQGSDFVLDGFYDHNCYGQRVEHRSYINQPVQDDSCIYQPVEHESCNYQPVEHESRIYQPLKNTSCIDQPADNNSRIDQPVEDKSRTAEMFPAPTQYHYSTYGQRLMPVTNSYSSDTYQFWVRQQPEKSRVVVKGREKEKKPVDPPPIVQLNIVHDPTFIHNPYIFCTCQLWHATEDRAIKPSSSTGTPNAIEDQVLVGQTVSSLHRLKDLDNHEKGFFVFGDLAVTCLGQYRLRFCLWEWSLNGYTTHLKDVFSNVFEVASAKEWDGVKESTSLSRAVADQGIKLRLRKESRHPNKRGVAPPNLGPPSTASTPLRPAGPAGSYPQDSIGSRPSSVASTPYGYGASPATGQYQPYPPTSSGGVPPGYYSQQYGSGYPSSYPYYAPQHQQHQQPQQSYGMGSGGSSYRSTTQAESTSAYPPPSNYSGAPYPYQTSYSQQQAPSYSYPATSSGQYPGRGSMADPANPPQLAPISGPDNRTSPQQQQPSQPGQQEQSRPSYEWPGQQQQQRR